MSSSRTQPSHGFCGQLLIAHVLSNPDELVLNGNLLLSRRRSTRSSSYNQGDLDYFIRALGANKTISRVTIGCGFPMLHLSFADYVEVVQVLGGLSGLLELHACVRDYSWNRKDSVLQSIAGAIDTATSLHTLRLECEQCFEGGLSLNPNVECIDTIGPAALAASVRGHTSLKRVFLGFLDRTGATFMNRDNLSGDDREFAATLDPVVVALGTAPYPREVTISGYGRTVSLLGLVRSPHITKLALHEGAAIWHAIAEAITCDDWRIQDLLLGYSAAPYSDPTEAVNALATGIKTTQRLQILSLELPFGLPNTIAAGAVAIARALRTDTTLREVNFTGMNGFTSDAYAAFSDTLKHKRHLQLSVPPINLFSSLAPPCDDFIVESRLNRVGIGYLLRTKARWAWFQAIQQLNDDSDTDPPGFLGRHHVDCLYRLLQCNPDVCRL